METKLTSKERSKIIRSEQRSNGLTFGLMLNDSLIAFLLFCYCGTLDVSTFKSFVPGFMYIALSFIIVFTISNAAFLRTHKGSIFHEYVAHNNWDMILHLCAASLIFAIIINETYGHEYFMLAGIPSLIITALVILLLYTRYKSSKYDDVMSIIKHQDAQNSNV